MLLYKKKLEMLLSNEKPEFSNSDETSSSVEEQLLENVKPNLISLTSSGSYSSHIFSDLRNQNAVHAPADIQNMDEVCSLDGHGISLKDLETSLDSFTVILEEPVKSSQNSLDDNVTGSNVLQSGVVSYVSVSPEKHSKRSLTTPDLLENCSKISSDQRNGGKNRAKAFRYLKRNWSSVQDLSTLPFSSLKNEPEFTYLMHNPCQSSTTISSVPKSKDSGLPRSLSCLSLGSGVKPYDHVPSKVREYINHIKKTESDRKKNIGMPCNREEDRKSLPNSIHQEPEEDLRHIICKLQQELNDKNNMISQIQENYDALLMKYADAENRIDRLRFKVIDSSVEEIGSHRTQDDFSIWNTDQSKNAFVNQAYSERSDFPDANLQFRRNLFQRSFLSGSSSLPPANMRPTGRETTCRNLDNEANFTPDFLAVCNNPGEVSELPFLAFSTPNHSFSKPESSAEFQQISLRESVTQLENQEEQVTVNCVGDCLMRRGEENLSHEDIIPSSHVSLNLSLRGTENIGRSGDQETIADICSAISEKFREKKSFFSKDFPDSEEYKTSSSETSILKVKQWQESLPPPEQIEPSCYDTLASNFCNSNIGEGSKNYSVSKIKGRSLDTKKSHGTKCPSWEEKFSKSIPHQITSPASKNKNISALCADHIDSPRVKNLVINRSYSKHLFTNMGLSCKHFFRSEPDLRVVMSKSDVDTEVKSKFENVVELGGQKIPLEMTSEKAERRIQPRTFCEMSPLQIEPCYCWEKSTVDMESKCQLKHCSSYMSPQVNDNSEHTVPRLKLGNFIDVNVDNLHKRINVNNINNSDIPSFVCSPSTSMSSTAMFSGCKHNAAGINLKSLDDSSTSYKNIQHKCTAANKRLRDTVCYSKVDCSQHKSVKNEICSCVCQMDCMCHNCKNLEEQHTSIFSRPHCAANSLWCNCCSHVVKKHSCGVNTDTSSHAFLLEHNLHKPPSASFCSCGVNTDQVDAADSSTHHVAFVSSAKGSFLKNKCDDMGNHNEIASKVQNNCRKQLVFMQDTQSAVKISGEQSLSTASSITDQDARDLAQCLEEVNHIASLLKAQSESIIEVVTANLADHIGRETRAFDVSDIP